MTKILMDERYRALKSKADGYDAIVALIVQANEDLKPEDVTLEVIQNVLNAEASQDNTTITEMETKLDDMTSARDSLQEQVDTLTEENERLRSLPGAETVTNRKPKADTAGEGGDDALVAFARKHAGDTAAIVAEMKKQGYETKKTI